MVDNAAPSRNPADESSLGGGLDVVFRKNMMKVDGQLPAVVISYDRDKNVAIVKPLISILKTNMQRVSRATIAEVPVLALGGGGYVINFPLAAGSKGWIEASDRDISLYMQAAQKEAPPNTFNIHSFEFGRFVPDVFGDFTIAGEDAGAMVIQSNSGNIKIVLSAAALKLKHPTLISLQAPEIDLVGHVNNTGGLAIDGLEFIEHGHDGVQTGSGTSDGPVAI